MRNITISLDEETARWARVEAAQQDMSLSRYVANMLRERMTSDTDYQRSAQDFLHRPRGTISSGSAYPTRSELYER